MTVDTNIIGRVQKLLNMTEARGCTPEEAANAASKAQRLLSDYNLSIGEVLKFDPNKRLDYIAQECGAYVPEWQEDILKVITRYNPVKTMKRGDAWTIFGTESNVEVVLFMWVYLTRETERASKEAYKLYLTDRYSWSGSKPLGKGVFLRSFFRGIKDGLNKKLSAKHNEAMNLNANSTALVKLVDEDLLKAWCEYTGERYYTPDERRKMEEDSKAWFERYRKQQEEQQRKHQEWYDSLSEEERIKYDKEQAKKRKSVSSYRGGGRSEKWSYEGYAAGQEAASRISLNDPVKGAEKENSKALT